MQDTEAKEEQTASFSGARVVFRGNNVGYRLGNLKEGDGRDHPSGPNFF